MSERSFQVLQGDALAVLRTLPECSFDACLCDPPYGLTANKKGGSGTASVNLESPYGRARIGTGNGVGGFMGMKWDSGVPSAEAWSSVLRVLKPGAFLLAFGGTRTFHRLTCAIEDAGFEIRDCLMWVHGQGFPKSLNFGCKCRGNALPYNHEEKAESEAQHDLRSLRETNLSETINLTDERGEVLLAGMSEQGTQGDWLAGSEPGACGGEQSGMEGRIVHRAGEGLPDDSDARSSACEGERVRLGAHTGGRKNPRASAATGRGGSPSGARGQGEQLTGKSEGVRLTQGALGDGTPRPDGICQACGGIKAFKGFGTALKPAYEPIILAMKPCDGTFAQNALKWGVAGLNVDGGRIGTTKDVPASVSHTPNNVFGQYGQRTGAESGHNPNIGRWPSNLLLDETSAAMLDEATETDIHGAGVACGNFCETGEQSWFTQRGGGAVNGMRFGDSGGASRFYYIAKADSAERHGAMKNIHPCVKPVDLTAYLAKLLLPPKRDTPRRILVPFCGSGSEIMGALRAGWDEAVGIEIEQQYVDIARARITNDAPLLNTEVA